MKNISTFFIIRYTEKHNVSFISIFLFPRKSAPFPPTQNNTELEKCYVQQKIPREEYFNHKSETEFTGKVLYARDSSFTFTGIRELNHSMPASL